MQNPFIKKSTKELLQVAESNIKKLRNVNKTLSEILEETEDNEPTSQ